MANQTCSALVEATRNIGELDHDLHLVFPANARPTHSIMMFRFHMQGISSSSMLITYSRISVLLYWCGIRFPSWSPSTLLYRGILPKFFCQPSHKSRSFPEPISWFHFEFSNGVAELINRMHHIKLMVSSLALLPVVHGLTPLEKE
jgi:hypothetical protein